MWPTDFSKIRMRPGGINYIYNIQTGYHYKAPYGKPIYLFITNSLILTYSTGTDVPKGKHFNPYFDHMIIGKQMA